MFTTKGISIFLSFITVLLLFAEMANPMQKKNCFMRMAFSGLHTKDLKLKQ